MSQVILPGGTIGILGAGQLGRMMTTAAKHMGYRVAVVGASPDDPAAQVADYFIEGDLMSPESAARLARVAGAITVEIENVSVPGLEAAACEVPVRPSAAVVRIAQHRLAEKQALEAMGVPLAPFREVTGAAQLREALESIGFPAILKTARGGYDGKGQVRIADPGQVERAFEELGAGRVDLVVEAVVPFEKEISVVVARDAAGRIAAYPVVENEHRRGILHRSIAPARVGTNVRERAVEATRDIAEGDRKSTRLNSSHVKISYAVFCLKKKKIERYLFLLLETFQISRLFSAELHGKVLKICCKITLSKNSMSKSRSRPLEIPTNTCTQELSPQATNSNHIITQS